MVGWSVSNQKEKGNLNSVRIKEEEKKRMYCHIQESEKKERKNETEAMKKVMKDVDKAENGEKKERLK